MLNPQKTSILTRIAILTVTNVKFVKALKHLKSSQQTKQDLTCFVPKTAEQENNESFLPSKFLLCDPYMVEESVKRSRLFTKYVLKYKIEKRRQEHIHFL